MYILVSKIIVDQESVTKMDTSHNNNMYYIVQYTIKYVIKE